jgi:hypothetical protein
MSLATEDEVKDLRRTVRKLEEEVAKLRLDAQPSPPKKKNSGNAAE